MAIKRTFLGFDQPALAATVDYLVARHGRDGALDLRHVMLVLPGGRAGRRLLELLVDRAATDSLRLRPPRIVKLGDLPEQLYMPQRPFASDLTQRLTWVQALRTVDASRLAILLAQAPPADDPLRWLPLGEMLAQLHRELAADGLDFGDVVKCGETLTDFEEIGRWQALREIQERYLRILDELDVWDQQTARLVAIERRECATEFELLLVATADLNLSIQQMLDLVAERVTALIHAPPELADRFDAHGRLVPEAWDGAPLKIDEKRIRLAYRAGDQAELAVRTVAEFNGRYAASEVAIGVPNEQLAPVLARKFDESDQRTRWVTGREVAQTGPYQLLEVIADWLAGERFDELAALLRHADIHRWLLDQNVPEGFLEELDAYRNNHVQSRVTDRWLGSASKSQNLRAAYEKLSALIAPLRTTKAPLDEIAEATRTLLINVYGEHELSRLIETDAYLLGACQQIDEAIERLTEVPGSMRPTLSAAQFLRIILDELSGATIASLVDPAAIEMLGWLELPLDDKPALVVTSMNEGFLPKSVNADPFLPNRLRQMLGLDDNQRRLARDAYALQVLLATRESLTLVVGKVDADGNTVAPSRLLFHDSPSKVAQRAQRLFREQPANNAPKLDTRLPEPQEKSRFFVPRPRPRPPLDQLAVTAFRTYLECPYRFYLKHILKLHSESDEAAEMDASAFGTLLHNVLAQFGDSDVAALTDPRPIEEFLLAELDQQARRRFGKFHLASIEVQLAQVRARLSKFAEWQAKWAGEGWRIRYTEWGPEEGAAPFEVDGVALDLHGRIDRIDEKEVSGEWFIFDYKSSNKPNPPGDTHYSKSKREWIDLQLPLYRYVAQSLEIESPQLGYIVLPREVDKTGSLAAEWTHEELAAADQVAAEIVRKIRRHEFWPPKDVNTLFDDFGQICQTSVFDRYYEDDDEVAPKAPDADEREFGS